ncbi:helix-turn-helix domain-containing protein (plasmid) [Providencia rettgeri]|uniref:helix-turn-helix domain-containing protein n=1 Tax=Providencia rettgeri TaxID=587 RepID=UPI001CA64963|nr:helix-turn-helix transcriptional regulator [Providencia rettgeri]QZY66601.1 helix-turn-helix domain-containing protein [Providencia rettgeri]
MPSGYERYINQYSSLSKLIGDYLKRQRHNNDLSGKELAKLMNLSQQQISRYERGMTQFNLETLFRFFYVLNVPVHDALFFFELITAWYEEKHPH